MADWNGWYTGAKTSNSLSPLFIYFSLWSSRVHQINYLLYMWSVSEVYLSMCIISCHIQSRNFHYLQISVTLVIPLNWLFILFWPLTSDLFLPFSIWVKSNHLPNYSGKHPWRVWHFPFPCTVISRSKQKAGMQCPSFIGISFTLAEQQKKNMHMVWDAITVEYTNILL